jgi:serine/threonine protein kinase
MVLPQGISGGNIAVLYSCTTNQWKLTDFELTTECPSNGAGQTEERRGTPGFRAPELIQNNPGEFTSKTDIWAAGCIYIQLVTGIKAFYNDWHVFQYAQSKEYLPILESHRFALSDLFFRPTAHSMISSDSRFRPDALSLQQRFEFFDQIIQLRITISPSRKATLAQCHHCCRSHRMVLSS